MPGRSLGRRFGREVGPGAASRSPEELTTLPPLAPAPARPVVQGPVQEPVQESVPVVQESVQELVPVQEQTSDIWSGFWERTVHQSC